MFQHFSIYACDFSNILQGFKPSEARVIAFWALEGTLEVI